MVRAPDAEAGGAPRLDVQRHERGQARGTLPDADRQPPEVAILSVGRIADRPVLRDGEVVVRSLGYISVTFDHRALDGKRAAEFGLDVIGRLERGEPGQALRAVSRRRYWPSWPRIAPLGSVGVW